MTEKNKQTDLPADGDEAELARVLRAGGRRSGPPPALQQQVRAAVHEEWLDFVRERRGSRRRRQAGFALAAGLTALAVGLWFSQSQPGGGESVFARLDRTAGTVQVDAGWLSARHAVVAGRVLHVGEKIITGADGGAALALDGGIVLRLDADTQVRVIDPQRLWVSAGAAYIDTGRQGAQSSPPLSIDTPHGVVRHLGTQYEVRVSASQLQLTVREGRVELTGRDGHSEMAHAGERLTFGADGLLARTAVLRDAPDWSWAVAMAAPFAIEDQPLAEFLLWAGRELGREISYATPDVEDRARRTILRGSVDGLSVEAAMMAVLSTTPLRSRIGSGQIRIEAD